jgi:hypothetical protein
LAPLFYLPGKHEFVIAAEMNYFSIHVAMSRSIVESVDVVFCGDAPNDTGCRKTAARRIFVAAR